MSDWREGQAAGRWSRVGDEWVTAIPAFGELGYDGQRFDTEVARFQADPAGYLASHDIVATIKVERG